VTVVDVENLRVVLASTGDDIVDHVSLEIESSHVFGLVGESGSGKTTVGHALLGHARRGLYIAGGSVRIDGVDVLALGPKQCRQVRGTLVSYIPQDPSAALNPALRIQRQLREAIRVHHPELRVADLDERIEAVLTDVNLPVDDTFMRRYPHQLSGGQQQRVAIAMAVVCSPKLIVLDEPTTGLDVTTQAQVLATVRRLCIAHGVSALYITHDLAVVGGLAETIGVMYAGRLVEVGQSERLFSRPAHPYTSMLISAIPDVGQRQDLTGIPGSAPPPGARPDGCFFAPRCPLRTDECDQAPPPLRQVEDGHVSRCLRPEDVVRHQLGRIAGGKTQNSPSPPVLSVSSLSAHHGKRQVLADISLDLPPGACLALVGESGSGKTTLARCVIGLHEPSTGKIVFRGEAVAPRARDRSSDSRRALQYVFQSPMNSLNPRKTIDEIVGTPVELFSGSDRTQVRGEVADALDRVGLPPIIGRRYPGELSGGERQRVAIARALVCAPEVLVCDEITSSLDVSVQAAIVNLLARLQREENLSLLFVTHNLALVRGLADTVVVLRSGRILESGPAGDLLDRPQDPYTRKFLEDTPRLITGNTSGTALV
jgi:peptide/nickel transport system ATP-binding protein